MLPWTRGGFVADVTRLDQINSAIEATSAQFGKLDILVNNVGNGFTNLAIDVPEEEFDFTMNVNLKATFFAAQAAAKIMMRQNGGRVRGFPVREVDAARPELRSHLRLLCLLLLNLSGGSQISNSNLAGSSMISLTWRRNATAFSKPITGRIRGACFR